MKLMNRYSLTNASICRWIDKVDDLNFDFADSVDRLGPGGDGGSEMLMMIESADSGHGEQAFDHPSGMSKEPR